MGAVGLLFWLLASDAPAGATGKVKVVAVPGGGESPFALAAVRHAGPALLAAGAAGFCYAALILWTPTYFVTEAGLTIGRWRHGLNSIPVPGST